MIEQDLNSGRMNEQDLVEGLRKGQKQAFNVLVATYQERLFKLAYGITFDHEDSKEVVQDVFISVFKHIRTFRQDTGLAAWLRKITINQCLNWQRKLKRRFKWQHFPLDTAAEDELCEESQKNSDPEKLFREKQFENHLMKAIRNLPEKIRLVFVLSAIEGLSYEDIAGTLDIKKGTVSSRLHLARKSLMDSLELSL